MQLTEKILREAAGTSAQIRIRDARLDSVFQWDRSGGDWVLRAKPVSGPTTTRLYRFKTLPGSLSPEQIAGLLGRFFKSVSLVGGEQAEQKSDGGAILRAAKLLGSFMGSRRNEMSQGDVDFLRSSFTGAAYQGEMFRVLFIESPMIKKGMELEALRGAIRPAKPGVAVSWSASKGGAEAYKDKYYIDYKGRDVREIDDDEFNDFTHEYSGHYAVTIRQHGDAVRLLPVLRAIDGSGADVDKLMPNGRLSDYVEDAENLEELAAMPQGAFDLVGFEYIP